MKWKRVLWDAGYKANMVAAGESDSRLEARLQQQQAAFSALSLDHAVAQMPRLQVCVLALRLIDVRGPHRIVQPQFARTCCAD